MKIVWKVWALSVLIVVSTLISAGAWAKSILTLPHKTATLKNGLRVVLVKYPSPGVVAYHIPVRVGSRNEVEKGKTGFAHFFEHLMFRGTKNRSAAEFGKLYNRLGCENNAWTSSDITNYHGVVAKIYLPQILDAEADRFMNLQFDEKAFKDEAGAVFGEYNKNAAQPEFQLEEALSAAAYKVHTYGHTTMGYKDDILKYTERYQDVWPFFRRYYRPDRTSVVLVGDVDLEGTMKLVESKFAKWKPSNQDPAQTVPEEPLQTEERKAEVKLNKPSQTRMTVANKIPAFTTENRDAAALQILSELAFSVTSEFQKEFRFEKKWLDAVSAPYQESIDPGLWTISVRFTQAGEGKEQEVLKYIDELLKRLAETPLPSDKIAAAKSRFQNTAVTRWFDSPEGLGLTIAWYTTFERDLGVLDRVLQRTKEVTAGDVMKFVKTNLVPTRRTVVTVKGS